MSESTMSGKGVLRSVKNYAKGYSDIQIKVREATSNDSWGPSGTLMNEIANATHNPQDFLEIMDMIDKRLNDKGKNWRHVFKALTVLDYCLHVGSENVVLYAKENAYVVKTLREFQHIDDTGRDVGGNVRQKAKDISSLLMDEARLREERSSRTQMRDRMAGVDNIMADFQSPRDRMSPYERPPGDRGEDRGGYRDEDRELRRALDESKRLAEESSRKKNHDEDDLQKAIRLSEQEARDKERRDRERLERENEKALFSNIAPETNQASLNAFPQQMNMNATGNPYQQQQVPWQVTGATNLSFSHPVGGNQMYSQFTGMPNNPYQQQAIANPYLQQQQQPQFTGMMQQPMVTGMQFQTPQMTGMQYQQAQPTGMQFPTSSISSVQTGQNNPFGANAGNTSQSNFMSSPSLQTSNTFGQSLQPQQTGFQANSYGSHSPQPNHFSIENQSNNAATPTSSKSTPTASRPNDTKFSKLNALLATGGDGLDTFGNTGNLRVPVGTGFANSMKLEYAKTGSGAEGFGQEESNVPKNFDPSLIDSPQQSFGNQPTRNPFGQSTSSFSTPSSSQPGNKKSLFEMMQEQKMQQQQQQQLQAQPTGMNFQTPQMTGFQQPSMTGYNGQGGSSFF
ncbi:hypothetical protein K450DRAFT_239548 [Umbelopsis ramanniana AG]|uniref:ENTH domain-containing protein n=1 Tax=Umbelopsis ramanniana AG TaxID=1314678 RepID=A0AAD5HEQ9_UMBRA|nr:uncharacterized protein K450DRAFT_239548 [Umbelopsis ramanniana AG]KAI8579886.1 hypothetical protein K450DRAFT_239548 [Umbelopsis ramanniana AG]